jgi:hypothetical protein
VYTKLFCGLLWTETQVKCIRYHKF